MGYRDRRGWRRIWQTLVVTGLCGGTVRAARAQAGGPPTRSPAPPASAGVHGVVTDSASRQPLTSVQVQLRRGGQVVAATGTAALGRFALAGLAPGSYALLVVRIGFRPLTRPVVLAAGDTTLDIVLIPTALMLDSITVQAAASPVAVDGHTGHQVFQSATYHGAPALTTSASRRSPARHGRRLAKCTFGVNMASSLTT